MIKKLMFITLLAFAGCASKPVLMQDCEQQGDSQYFHCLKVGR